VNRILNAPDDSFAGVSAMIPAELGRVGYSFNSDIPVPAGSTVIGDYPLDTGSDIS